MKPTTIAGILTAGILIVGGILFKIGDTAPIAKNPTYNSSIEKALYDTIDGQIHVGEFALQPDGVWWQIYLADQIVVTGTSTYTITAHLDGSKVRPTGMTEIHMIGRQYFDVYVDDNKKTFEISTDKASYNNLGKNNPVKPNYPI